jgi:hypothetical protein
MTPAMIGNVIRSSAMGPSLRRDDDVPTPTLPFRQTSEAPRLHIIRA